MIIRSLPDKESPSLASTVRCAEDAVIVGTVHLSNHVSIWYHCTLRGDIESITVGEATNIQDGCVVHCGFGYPTHIGSRVVIGHRSVVHGCTVEDGCLIGMGAVILDGAIIGRGSLVGAGSLVTGGKIIPPGSLVTGVPGKIVRNLTLQEQQEILANADYYVKASQLELPLVAGGAL